MSISLVTGGAGFVGSHLVHALLARGERVRVLDNFSSGTRANLPSWNEQLEIIPGDLTDRELVRRVSAGVRYVFHLATPPHASYGADATLERWAYAADTLNVLSAAYEAGVKRMIYSSCHSVYGPASGKPLTENDPTLPLSPYAFAKLTGEQQCVAFSAIVGLETVRLRYFNVYGPQQVSAGARPPAICETLKAMLLGQSPVVEGDGEEPQDFIYVEDVVHANLLAAEAPRVSGKVFNIARGRPTTLNEVVATVNRLLGTNLQPRYTSAGPAIRDSGLTEIARAEVELGFCPGTDLEQGLWRCIAYYRARPHQLGCGGRAETHPEQGPHFALDDVRRPVTPEDTGNLSRPSARCAGSSLPKAE
jgi:UDP-glucose 4-epimerase